MPSLTINGVDAESLGLTLAEAPGWLDMPPRDIPTSPVIGRPGVKALADPVEGPRSITLTSTSRSATSILTRTQIDNIKLALAAAPLSIVFSDHSDRHVTAYLKSFTVRMLQGASGPFVQEALGVDCVLAALDPLSYDNALAGVFQWYAPGDTVAGEVSTRSTSAAYINSTAGISTAVINVKRDAHFPFGTAGGTRTLLLEDTRTNVNSLALSSWAPDGASITAGQPDPAGGTSAIKITHTGGNARITNAAAFTGNGVKALQFGVLAGNAAASTITVRDITAAIVRVQVTITWTAGVPSLTIVAGAGTLFPVRSLGGGFYIIAFAANSVVAANANRIEITPDNSSTGKFITAYRPNFEDASFPSSFMDASVVRGADTYAIPFTAPPQEGSFYVKFVELGTLAASARVFEIGSAAGANPKFLVFSQGGFYTVFYHNGVGSVQSSVVVAPTYGDTVELVPRLYLDGSVDIIQSINGAAPTTSVRSAGNPLPGANPLPASWAGQLCYLNSIGTTGAGVGLAAFYSFKAAAAIRTFTDMIALPRLPLGTGPIRPLVTITGASTNPVISLYNKAGVVVASLSLTISTVGGDVLAIDMDAKTIKKNGVSAISSILAGDFFSIDPADQANFGAPGPRIDSSSGATSVAYYRTWR